MTVDDDPTVVPDTIGTHHGWTTFVWGTATGLFTAGAVVLLAAGGGLIAPAALLSMAVAITVIAGQKIEHLRYVRPRE